jgi:hypothetical protein
MISTYLLSNLRNFVLLIEEIMQSISNYIIEENDILYKKGVNIGIQQGENIGLEKGEERILKGSIERMLSKGFPLVDIADILGVDILRIKKIIEKYNLK